VVKNLAKFFPKMNYHIAVKNGHPLKEIVQNLMNAINETAKERKFSMSK
jgi:hypothetical protein